MKSHLFLQTFFVSLLLFSCSKEPSLPPKATSKSISQFQFELVPEAKVTIDSIKHTINIEVGGEIDITKLTPTIKLSDKATILPASGTSLDFSKTQNYTVTAEDGSTQVYTVKVDKDVNALVVVANEDGYVYAFDSGTGVQKWKTETGWAIWGSVTVANGTVFVGAMDAKIYALDLNTGNKKWTFDGDNTIIKGSPTEKDGNLYFTDGYELTSLNAKTGSLNWKTKEQHAFTTAPVIADGVAYVLGRTGFLHAIDIKTGKNKWLLDSKKRYFNSQIALSDGLIYFTMDDAIFAVNAATGNISWTVTSSTINSDTSPAISNGLLYFVDFYQVLCLDGKTGAKKWALDVKYAGGSVIVSGQTIYVNTLTGASSVSLPADNSSKASVKWYFDNGYTGIQNMYIPSPTYSNGIVYSPGIDKGLYAIDSKTGKKLVSYISSSTRAFSQACVVTAQGNVYHSGESGAVQ